MPLKTTPTSLKWQLATRASNPSQSYHVGSDAPTFSPSTATRNQDHAVEKSPNLNITTQMSTASPTASSGMPTFSLRQRHASSASAANRLNHKAQEEADTRAAAWTNCMELSLKITAARTDHRIRNLEEAARLSASEQEEQKLTFAASKRAKIEKYEDIQNVLTRMEDIIKYRYDLQPTATVGNDVCQRCEKESAQLKATDNTDGGEKKKETNMLQLLNRATKLVEEMRAEEENELDHDDKWGMGCH